MVSQINEICTAIKEIGDKISDIRVAFSAPPPKIDTAEMPALYPLTGEAEHDWEIEGADYGVITRNFRIQVAVIPVGQGTPAEKETRCRPLIDAVIDAFASRPNLGGVDHVQNSITDCDSGIVILPEYSGNFIGFEVRLKVSVYASRTYVDY